MTRLLQSFLRLMAVFTALSLAGCATSSPTATLNGMGRVNGITETTAVSQGTAATGSIGGALVGGAIGSLFGAGSGKAIMTGVGATAGSVAGSNAAARHGNLAWDVSIRFDDGIDRVIRTNSAPFFKPGDRVRVVNGNIMPPL